jgi:DNA-binding helix-hairpin-helix protein with protein kinase domain
MNSLMHHPVQAVNCVSPLGLLQSEFNRLPRELIFKIFSFSTIMVNVILSGACRELFELYSNSILKRLKKYVLKEQDESKSLLAVLENSDYLEALVLDCRSKAQQDRLEIMEINDVHIEELAKKPRAALRSLVMRGCLKITNQAFTLISSCCQYLTALGKKFFFF